jgi:hypothetical protein
MEKKNSINLDKDSKMRKSVVVRTFTPEQLLDVYKTNILFPSL